MPLPAVTDKSVCRREQMSPWRATAPLIEQDWFTQVIC